MSKTGMKGRRSTLVKGKGDDKRHNQKLGGSKFPARIKSDSGGKWKRFDSQPNTCVK